METYSLIFYEYVIKLVTRRRSDSLMITSPKTDQFLKRANEHWLHHSPRFSDLSSTDPCRGLIMKVWVISNKPIDCEAPCPRVAAKSRLKCCPGAAIHHPGLETEYQNCPDPTSGHLALLRGPGVIYANIGRGFCWILPRRGTRNWCLIQQNFMSRCLVTVREIQIQSEAFYGYLYCFPFIQSEGPTQRSALSFLDLI